MDATAQTEGPRGAGPAPAIAARARAVRDRAGVPRRRRTRGTSPTRRTTPGSRGRWGSTPQPWRALDAVVGVAPRVAAAGHAGGAGGAGRGAGRSRRPGRRSTCSRGALAAQCAEAPRHRRDDGGDRDAGARCARPRGRWRRAAVGGAATGALLGAVAAWRCSRGDADEDWRRAGAVDGFALAACAAAGARARARAARRGVRPGGVRGARGVVGARAAQAFVERVEERRGARWWRARSRGSRRWSSRVARTRVAGVPLGGRAARMGGPGSAGRRDAGSPAAVRASGARARCSRAMAVAGAVLAAAGRRGRARWRRGSSSWLRRGSRADGPGRRSGPTRFGAPVLAAMARGVRARGGRDAGARAGHRGGAPAAGARERGDGARARAGRSRSTRPTRRSSRTLAARGSGRRRCGTTPRGASSRRAPWCS